MLRQCMGALALLVALGGAHALADSKVRCADGSLRKVDSCYKKGGGVWSGSPYGSVPSQRGKLYARCRDGTFDSGKRACRFRGGVSFWM
jgi:hypothetical protein